MTEDQAPLPATAPESGFTYRTVTRYWPRIAVGLVALAAILEWVIGGLTSNGALEFYVFAWASATGGLWFLFEKAERVLSGESRLMVVRWLKESDFELGMRSIPQQFVALFDRVFGERHLTLACFRRSAGVSAVVLAVGFALLVVDPWTGGLQTEPLGESVFVLVLFFGWMVVANVPFDYLSLLESRWVIRRMTSLPRIAVLILLDLWVTLLIWLLPYAVFLVAVAGGPKSILLEALWLAPGYDMLIPEAPPMVGQVFQAMFRVSVLSALTTSLWLWLYAASVLVSRVLVRMSGGVGFLLKVTDVEKQPFRSMGFTSVVLVSVLFLVGLPFVLLA